MHYLILLPGQKRRRGAFDRRFKSRPFDAERGLSFRDKSRAIPGQVFGEIHSYKLDPRPGGQERNLHHRDEHAAAAGVMPESNL